MIYSTTAAKEDVRNGLEKLIRFHYFEAVNNPNSKSYAIWSKLKEAQVNFETAMIKDRSD